MQCLLHNQHIYSYQCCFMSCYDSFHVGTIFYLPKYLFTVESFCIRPGIIQPRTINKHTNRSQSYKKKYVASQDREHISSLNTGTVGQFTHSRCKTIIVFHAGGRSTEYVKIGFSSVLFSFRIYFLTNFFQ